MNYFITAIDTNIGKTLISSVLVQKLGFDYWKPIQSGLESPTDTETVQSLVKRTDVTFHTERFRLNQPLSPHNAAELDNISIKLTDFNLPTNRNLIIEGAGGVMVPLNYEGDTMLDLMRTFPCEIIIVSKNYLGSINHTLMTCNVLKNAGLTVKGLIFSGERNKSSEKVIQIVSNLPILGYIPTLTDINKEVIDQLSRKIEL
jgi:dethiobiotin synthetase